jgi:hypothetical protein
MNKNKIMPTREWIRENTAWRLIVISLVREWAIQNGQGPYNTATANVVRKRMAELEKFIRHMSPDPPPDPIDAQDAAGLLVLPSKYALHMAHKIFGGHLEVEDIKSFNLDWFVPKEFES